MKTLVKISIAFVLILSGRGKSRRAQNYKTDICQSMDKGQVFMYKSFYLQVKPSRF